MSQLGFFVNSAKCTGCKTCVVSCKDRKHLDVGQKLRRVYEFGGGGFTENPDGTLNQNVFSYYVSIACNHCSNPTCVTGCPTGAMHKRKEDGLVYVDQSLCIGCRYCEMRCPYGAPQFDEEKGVMNKCDGCFDLVAKGEKPSCVASCPQRALDFGPIDELRKEHGMLRDVAPLPDSESTDPNLIIKVHPDGQAIETHNASLMNLGEV